VSRPVRRRGPEEPPEGDRNAAPFSTKTTTSEGAGAATALLLVGVLTLVVRASVLSPATSLFVGIHGGVLMLIGGNSLIGGAIITGPATRKPRVFVVDTGRRLRHLRPVLLFRVCSAADYRRTNAKVEQSIAGPPGGARRPARATRRVWAASGGR